MEEQWQLLKEYLEECIEAAKENDAEEADEIYQQILHRMYELES